MRIDISKLEGIALSDYEVILLPDYSASLPDSYKRPISRGGRPWRCKIDYYDESKGWLYGEYVDAGPGEPGYLRVKWRLILKPGEILTPAVRAVSLEL